MAKNTFFSSFKNAKNANFDRLAWTINCDVIIEHIRILIISSDSSLNSVSDWVLKHVPKMKNDQNMLIFPNQTNTILMNFSLLLFPIASGIVKFTSFSSDFKRFSTTTFLTIAFWLQCSIHCFNICNKEEASSKESSKEDPKESSQEASSQETSSQEIPKESCQTHPGCSKKPAAKCSSSKQVPKEWQGSHNLSLISKFLF